jgi:hypothetical protein
MINAYRNSDIFIVNDMTKALFASHSGLRIPAAHCRLFDGD